MDITDLTPIQKRHARFHDPATIYHVISKTDNGTFLLAPKKGIKNLCAGIVGKPQEHFMSVSKTNAEIITSRNVRPVGPRFYQTVVDVKISKN